MSKVHLVVPDQHAHPAHNNDRADLLAKLTTDLRPDVVINIGDAADMPSLSGYDRNTKSFQGRNYEKDITSHLEFQDRWWSPVKRSKKKLPHRVVFEGNHEHRVKRAINLQPELEGDRFGVSFKDFDFNSHYDDIVEYEGNVPGVATIDGITYAHYFVSGVMGNAIGGEHPGYSLLTKKFCSCTQGHTHTFDFATRTVELGKQRINGLVCGVFQDYRSGWAGVCNDLWWSGVVIKRNVDGTGNYDLQAVSLDQLKKEYLK